MGNLTDLLDQAEGKKSAPAASPSAGGFGSLPEGFNLDSEVKKAADKAGVPYHIFRGLVKQESSDKHDAKSPVGALGYAQLMPATAKEVGADPYDPIQNLEGGARYLKQQIDTFGDLNKAIAAYNAGPGAVQKYNGIPPFAETQAYVPKVLKFAKEAEGTAPKLSLTDLLDQAGAEKPTIEPQAQAVEDPPNTPPQEFPVGAYELRPNLKKIAQARLEARKQGSGGDNSNALGTGLVDWANTVTLGSLTRGNAIAQSVFGGDGGAVEKDLDPYQNYLIEQDVQKMRQAEHPTASSVGQVGGILTPQGIPGKLGAAGKWAGNTINSALKLDKFLPLASKLIPRALEGGAMAVGGEVGVNPEATPESVKDSAVMGGVTNAIAGPVLGAVGKGLKATGKGVANFLLRQPLMSEVGETVAAQAPKMSLKSIANTAQKKINEGGELVKNALDKSPDAKFNIAKIAQDDDILKFINKFDTVEERNAATRMLNKLAKFEKMGEMKVEKADELRKMLWDMSKYNKKGDIGTSAIAQFHNMLGKKVRNELAKIMPEEYGVGLAKQAKNIPVKNAAEDALKKNPNLIIRALLGYASAGLSELGTHSATATPIASGLYQTGKGLTKGADPIAKILTAIGLVK